jgi:hypothetical protein
MRQHIGAACWHFEEAAKEAPAAGALPAAVQGLMLNGQVTLDTFGIDDGYVHEAARRDGHLVPES